MPGSLAALEGFLPLELSHREAVNRFLAADPPRVSELSFTNLFMWRGDKRPAWREIAGCLCLVQSPCGEQGPFGLMPMGPGDKAAALDGVMQALAKIGAEPKACRVDAGFVESHLDPERYEAVADRDNFDYVYEAQKLIKLPGRKLHRKKNHLNRFIKSTAFAYRALDAELVGQVLDMQESWCALRECHQSPGLLAEDLAIYQALQHFGELDYIGGVILIDGRVKAFSLGEMLNPQTAVIHIEKADPEVPGLYAAINQRFAQEAWGRAEYINREQDLGLEGLRAAKESYQPHHLVEKFTLTPRR